jgi:hypothetical protein
MSTVEPDQVNTCVGIKPNKSLAFIYQRDKFAIVFARA